VCVVTLPPDFGCGESVLVDDVLCLVEVMCESDRSQRRIKKSPTFFIFFSIQLFIVLTYLSTINSPFIGKNGRVHGVVSVMSETTYK
jgi:uncharacterized membrane protein